MSPSVGKNQKSEQHPLKHSRNGNRTHNKADILSEDSDGLVWEKLDMVHEDHDDSRIPRYRHSMARAEKRPLRFRKLPESLENFSTDYCKLSSLPEKSGATTAAKLSRVSSKNAEISQDERLYQNLGKISRASTSSSSAFKSRRRFTAVVPHLEDRHKKNIPPLISSPTYSTASLHHFSQLLKSTAGDSFGHTIQPSHISYHALAPYQKPSKYILDSRRIQSSVIAAVKATTARVSFPSGEEMLTKQPLLQKQYQDPPYNSQKHGRLLHDSSAADPPSYSHPYSKSSLVQNLVNGDNSSGSSKADENIPSPINPGIQGVSLVYGKEQERRGRSLSSEEDARIRQLRRSISESFSVKGSYHSAYDNNKKKVKDSSSELNHHSSCIIYHCEKGTSSDTSGESGIKDQGFHRLEDSRNGHRFTQVHVSSSSTSSSLSGTNSFLNIPVSILEASSNFSIEKEEPLCSQEDEDGKSQLDLSQSYNRSSNPEHSGTLGETRANSAVIRDHCEKNAVQDSISTTDDSKHSFGMLGSPTHPAIELSALHKMTDFSQPFLNNRQRRYSDERSGTVFYGSSGDKQELASTSRSFENRFFGSEVISCETLRSNQIVKNEPLTEISPLQNENNLNVTSIKCSEKNSLELGYTGILLPASTDSGSIRHSLSVVRSTRIDVANHCKRLYPKMPSCPMIMTLGLIVGWGVLWLIDTSLETEIVDQLIA